MRQMSVKNSGLQPGKTVDGAAALLQRHRAILLTAPRDLPQDPEWGFGLYRYLGKPMVESDTKTWESLAREAHLKDPETLDATVRITLVDEHSARYELRVVAKSGVVATLEEEISI